MPRLARMISGVLLLLLTGCASGLHDFSASVAYGPFWKANQRVHFERLADQYEKSGDLNRAIECLLIARHLQPDNDLADLDIDRLSQKAKSDSKRHMKRARVFARRSETQKATTEYLKALINDPSNQKALENLKALYSEPVYKPFKVRKKDTLNTIAVHAYHDSRLGFVVGFFNDLSVQDRLRPGMILSLPAIGNQTGKKRHIAKDPVMQAEALYKHKAYDPALIAARTALKNPDTRDIARDLIDRIYMKMAADQMDAGRFDHAKKTLVLVTPGYRGKDAALKSVNQAMLEQSLDTDLETASTLLHEKQYQKALDALKAIKGKGGPNAAITGLWDDALYGLAQKLYKEKKDLEALAAVKKIRQKEARPFMEKIMARIHDRAESHYRNGVKFFINEELKNAISQWEMTLKLVPDHVMAKENIKITRRLLQKIKDIE